MPETQSPSLPPIDDLVADFRALASRSDALSRYLASIETGYFLHPDGRKDPLENVVLGLEQAALLSHLSRICPTPMSAEAGFGMGASATVILASRHLEGKTFTHLVYDPLGLSNGRGKVVEAYLEKEFPESFLIRVMRSQTGLARLIENYGQGTVGLTYIDGDHSFEGVMSDFVLADLLCCLGGYIMFDDALYPATETVINYIARNRPDYAVAHRVTKNATVVCKKAPDTRHWAAFTPFDVPNRHDWTPSPDPAQ
jgi:hypothetical protein